MKKRINVGDLVRFWGHPRSRMGYLFSRSSNSVNNVIEAIMNKNSSYKVGNVFRDDDEIVVLVMSFGGPEQVPR
jgi:hypothetical protein